MIELKDICYNYDKGIVALRDINFKTVDGEVIAILGENGAGKTTMLKIVMGLLEPTYGKLNIDGLNPKNQYENMSFITEEGSSFTYMKPLEYGEFLNKFFNRFDMKLYIRLLDFFYIKDKKIKEMSTGEKAKVEIASGMSKNSKYIIMDEPFLGKDMFTRRDFLKLMASVLNDNQTVLLATHQIDEMENFADRAIIFHKGNLVKDIYIDDIRNEGKTLQQVMKEATGYEEERYKKVFE